jgi:hypothetical protein
MPMHWFITYLANNIFSKTAQQLLFRCMCNATALDKCKWRCRTCKSSRSLRLGTFFSQSRLQLQQLLDLMMCWSQGADSHKFIRRNCIILSDTSIVDWKHSLRDLYGDYFTRHPAFIGGVGHVVEIDGSANIIEDVW